MIRELLHINQNRQKFVNLITRQYPNALIEPYGKERFIVILKDVEEIDFYKFATISGFIECCMGFRGILYKHAKGEENPMIPELKAWAKDVKQDLGIEDTTETEETEETEKTGEEHGD